MNREEQIEETRRPDADSRRGPSSRWLHNSGMAPRTKLIVSANSSKRPCGHGVRFQLPLWDGIAESLMSSLRRKKLTAARNLEQFCQELDHLSQQIALPSAVVVSTQEAETDFICECPLVCAAVLSKTGHSTYLRDKQPCLDSACNSVVLVLPEQSDLDRFQGFLARTSSSRSLC